jgi:hypothetical protein
MGRDNVKVFDPVKGEYVKPKAEDKQIVADHEAIIDGTFAQGDEPSGPVVTSGAENMGAETDRATGRSRGV